ncbi:MAG: UxaA family hydrolase, partial [Actinobacteria bacterium]|nr:UxaA family hydrolase [Actinomycetota bacterium]
MESFSGYERSNGSVGIRNHVAIIPTVACANGVAGLIAKEAPQAVPLFHGHGCGRAGRDLELHIRTLANLGRHPNVGAVLVVGLGCEVIKAEHLAPSIAESGKPVEYLDIQSEGGSLKTAEKGLKLVEGLIESVGREKRTEVGVERLILGLECGGSDAFSGVTANPSVGVVADWLVDKGGMVILTENTEMIGTSHILERRACSPQVAAEIKSMISAAEQRTRDILGPLASMVIAPGNMDGGMSSIQEKSLGCIAKGGSSAIRQVIDYAGVPSEKGLVLMDAPGFDTESTSGLAASGAQVILFTTGQGNPIGFPTVPVIKIASTSRLYRAMGDDIDINAGMVLEGKSLADVAEDIKDVLGRVLNGEQSKAERNGQGGITCLYTT